MAMATLRRNGAAGVTLRRGAMGGAAISTPMAAAASETRSVVMMVQSYGTRSAISSMLEG